MRLTFGVTSRFGVRYVFGRGYNDYRTMINRFVTIRSLSVLMVLALIGVWPSLAQPRGAAQHVTWSVVANPKAVQPGELVQLTFSGTIGAGWKMYAVDSPPPSRGVRLHLDDFPDGIAQQGDVWQAEPKEGYDPNFKKDVRYFEGHAEVGITLGLSDDVTAGAKVVEGQVEYMICNDRMCLPPTRTPFSATFTVVENAGGAADRSASTPRLPTSTQPARGAAKYVQWATSIQPVVFSPGTQGIVELRAEIADGFKMYAMGEKRPRGVYITWGDLPEGFRLAGDTQQDTPQTGYDPNFKEDVNYFEHEASFYVPIAVAESVEEGDYRLDGRVRFMVCNDTFCTPPMPLGIQANIVVGTSPIEANAALPNFTGSADATLDLPSSEREATGPALISTNADIETARTEGLWAFLMIAAGAGLLALLTPCVFPMIPLTVSYFSKHTTTKGEALRMASVYGMSIVFTFTGLGILMALLVGAAGAQTIAANPWVNLFIGLVFILFAFSLLGLFEIRVPHSVLNFFNRQSDEQSGYLGILFMGLTLTLVSFSCTVPFVGGLLAATAGGEWFFPVLGMLAFSSVFALPFVLFALFPRGLNSLPKSGSWMNAVKVVLGFIELAAAIKFLSNADLVWGTNLLSRPLAIALVVVIFFMAGLYLLGKLRLAHEPPVEGIGVMRLMFSMAFFGTALYMIPGLFGAPLRALDAYLPPRMASDISVAGWQRDASGVSGVGHDALDWVQDDIEAAYVAARQAEKPIFVDFTGYTCTNCRDMEANVFPHPEVAERFERNFVLLRLYTDDQEHMETFQNYQVRLTDTVALPTYAVITPDEDVLVQHSGIASVETFVRFLDDGVTAYRNQQLVQASRADAPPLTLAQ